MQKFVHNLFNATKISFFNEMRVFCTEIGVDANKIMPVVAKSAEGIWNPEYGIKDYGPFGGKCLPKDTLAFVEWAKRGGMHARMIEATIEVNKMYERRLQNR
jgi:UDPglucose 6-dehydrogenase